MQDIVLQDPTFDISLAGQYHLSFRLGSDGLCAALLHLPSRVYQYIHVFKIEENQTSRIGQLIKSDANLNGAFAGVSVIVVNRNYLLIPAEFSGDTKTATELMRFHYQPDKNPVKVAHLPDYKVNVAYSYDNNVAAEFRSIYPNATVYPHVYPYLWNILTNRRAVGNEHRAFININGGFMDVAVIKGEKLLFGNSFNYQHPDDVIFYLLKVYENLRIKPTDVQLNVSGNVALDSDIYARIKKFFPLQKIERPASSYQFLFPFSNSEPHYFLNLLNLYPCVLSVENTVAG
jgi:hypothetical protein